MWQVDPESRMNECFSGESLISVLKGAKAKTVLVFHNTRPSSQSSKISDAEVCDCLTIGVRDQVLLCPRISP
jgi:hypothetical protein